MMIYLDFFAQIAVFFAQIAVFFAQIAVFFAQIALCMSIVIDRLIVLLSLYIWNFRA